MKNCPLLSLASILLLFSMTACSPRVTPDPNQQINQFVAATVAAIPTPTLIIQPTPYPSPTAFDLNGLFCEYQFCIGHPVGMAFYDHLATLNPQTPSQYNNGFIVAYKIPSTVINVIWLEAPGTADPQFLLDTILDDEADSRTGNLDVKLVRGMNVMYTQITTTISPEVPFGGAAAWTCDDRVFAWKIYTLGPDEARLFFEEALTRFTCGQ